MGAPPGFHAYVRSIAGVPTQLWERSGDGPALVFLPGGALDTVELTWSEVIQRLPAPWRLVVADLPGFGGSGAPVAATTAWYTDWLAALLDHLSARPVFVVASSEGAAFALSLACRAPDRVAGLVLSGAYGLQERVHLHALAARLVRLPGLARIVRTVLRPRPVLHALFRLAVLHPADVTPDLVADAHAGLTPPHALDAFIAWLQHELRPGGCTTDLRPCLPGLAVPLLLLHGTLDPFVPLRAAKAAAALAPHARLVALPAAHLPPREHPHTVTAEIRAFVQAHPPPPAAWPPPAAPA